MYTRATVALAVLALQLVAAGAARAATPAPQQLSIRNARVIVGPGHVIERGDILVRDGRIVAVSAAGTGSRPRGGIVIDGTDMTAIAGYIDGHRHLIQGNGPEGVAQFMKESASDRMRELLESGVTTVQSGGDDNEAIQELKRRIESGELKGPRIITSGRIPYRIKEEADVRTAIDKVVKAGAESIAEVRYPEVVWPYAPTELDTRNLSVGIAEAKRLGVDFQVHAVSDLALVGAVRLGARKLVHSVNINWVTVEQAKEVAAAGAEVASIAGFGSPLFNVFSQDNKPTFRDGKPWPSGIIDSQGLGQEAGYMPVNLRTLHDNGVSVSYASDTNFSGPAALAHELKSLSLVFSPTDLIEIMGPNSAKFVSRGKDIGTLEAGKVADIVLLGGNPFDGYWNFLTAVVVIKGGVIGVDKRGQPGAGKPVARAM